MKRVLLSLSLGLFAVAAISGCAPRTKLTALDRYVGTPDSTYSWKAVSSDTGEGFTRHVIALTSQTWRSPQEVDRTQWEHWLSIIVPEKLDSTTALLYITSGKHSDPAPAKPDSMLTAIAVGSGAVVAELRGVPNQPLVFSEGEQRPRVEDDLIAYTWDKYLRGGDELWPARLPMTKSAVRAMDTVTAFMNEQEKKTVDTFVVAGGSKRGWTTWTTAAVDKRVVAFAPIVIDMLNVEPSFIHHWEAYGFWAPAVQDYTNMRLMDWMGSKEYHALLDMVEPYSYRNRFKHQPKFIMNASGDEFFLPDSSQFYYDDIPGEKFLRYVPNTGHSMRNTDSAESLGMFFYSIVHDTPRPQYDWSVEADGAIRVTTKDKPVAVKLWQATNPDARDFRFTTIGAAYTSTDLSDQGGGVYVGKLAAPPKGWTAYFVELTYDKVGPRPFKVTTEVHVLPKSMPFKYTPPAGPPK